MQLTPTQIDDELRFWLNQDREHNLFMFLGLEEPALKAAAKELHDRYAHLFSLRRGDNLQMMLRDVVPASQALKRRAIAMQERGAWIGWLFPSFIAHIRDEIDVMLARIRPGGIQSRDELCFGNRMNADHLAFASHLVDPSEATAKAAIDGKLRPDAVLATNQCFTDTYGSLLELSRRTGREVDAFFSNLDLRAVKDVIHPALAAHVVREGKRFLQVIDQRLPKAA